VRFGSASDEWLDATFGESLEPKWETFMTKADRSAHIAKQARGIDPAEGAGRSCRSAFRRDWAGDAPPARSRLKALLQGLLLLARGFPFATLAQTSAPAKDAPVSREIRV
jgi:hypothetical protein